MIEITVLTPTFNRAHTLQRVFQSLKNQSSKNFEWIIIDDGSNDNTQQLVNEFILMADFKVKYLYKKNGGKHTAINLGIENITTELTIILDSDDYLLEDAIQKILIYWNKFKVDETLCGLSFLKGYPNNKIVGSRFTRNCFKSNHIECRHNIGESGDKAEVFLTKILKEFKFPEIENEKFVPEDLIWTRIARKYSTIYINEIIYMCEYLPDGLSMSGKKILINSPKALRILYNESLDSSFKIKLRIKHCIQYIIYSLFSHVQIKNIFNESNSKLITVITFPLGYILYIIWKSKYSN